MGDTLTNRVRRGARLIDKRLGRTALRRVRIRELDLSDDCDCVLGQLYGEFGYGLDALGLWGEPAVQHGFDVHFADDDETYARLTELWADEVRKRRGKAA